MLMLETVGSSETSVQSTRQYGATTVEISNITSFTLFLILPLGRQAHGLLWTEVQNGPGKKINPVMSQSQ
jgi:hypothetical protein